MKKAPAPKVTGRLLTSRQFLPLFLTHVLAVFNDNLFKSGVTILITYKLAQQTGLNAGMLISLGSALFILPFVLFSGLAGQVADKFDKSRLAFLIKLFEVPLMLAAFLSLLSSSVPIMLAMLFGMGTYAAFLGPVKYSILPQALPEKRLLEANSLFEGSTFLAILTGTIAGGLLVLQPGGLYYVGGGSLALAILGVLTSWLIPRSPATAPTLKFNKNPLAENLKLFGYVAQTKQMLRIVLGISWFWGLGAMVLNLIPIYTREVLHGDENTSTLLLAMFSIGIAVGSALCNRILKGKISLLYVPLAAFALSAFGFLWVAATGFLPAGITDLQTPAQLLANPIMWLILTSLIGLAISGGMFIVPLYAFMQARGHTSSKSRLIAGNNFVNAFFMVAGALLCTVLLTVGASATQTLAVAMGLNFIVACIACLFLAHEFNQTILRALVRYLYQVKVHGLENLKDLPPSTIVVANHTSYLDAVLLAAFIPVPLVFAINDQVAQKWWLKPLLQFLRTYALSPTNPYSLKHLVNEVKAGTPSMIFPEGRITVTGSLMKVYQGAAMIAVLADATVVRIRIDGAQYTPFSYLKGVVRQRWFPPITLTVMPPVKLKVDESLRGRQRRNRAGAQLQQMMSELVFASTDTNTTLFNTLLEARHIHGKNFPILNDITFTPVTYAALTARSLVLARHLKKYGSNKGTLGIMLPNASAAAITFFAAQAAHLTPAMLNFTVGEANLLSACRTACLTHIVTSHKFIEAAKLEDLAKALTKGGLKLIYLEDIRASLTVADKLRALAATRWPHLFYRAHHNEHDRPAAVLFTSGSEGTPKAVVLTHSNLLSNRAQLSASVAFNGKDKVLNALPMFHSFGLTGGTLMPLLSGVPCFLYPSPLHYRIIPELAYDLGATILFGTDTFLSGYGRMAHPYDFYTLRLAFAGAEKLQDETRQLWSTKFGIRVLEGYGATEASPAIALNAPMHYKAGTVGKILPGIQTKLTRTPGTQGSELAIRGPNIMAGYWLADNPGVLKTPKDGWYPTGDIVNIDDEGFLSIVGRLKRFAKVGGEMVSLGQVEDFAAKCWPKSQHAVVAVPDARKGQQLVLFTTEPKATLTALRKYILAHGGMALAIPRTLVSLKKIPTLATGKTNYPQLQPQAEKAARG